MVEGIEPINTIKADPTDNKYLATAVEGEAKYIVSGDHHAIWLCAQVVLGSADKPKYRRSFVAVFSTNLQKFSSQRPG